MEELEKQIQTLQQQESKASAKVRAQDEATLQQLEAELSQAEEQSSGSSGPSLASSTGATGQLVNTVA